MQRGFVGFAMLTALSWALWPAAPAAAHIRDTFDGVNVVVGWAEEPAFASLPNAVQVFLREPAPPPPPAPLGQTAPQAVPPAPPPGHAQAEQPPPEEVPVDPQQVQLTVEVLFGEKDAATKTGVMPLSFFRFGRPGEFRSEPIAPTRPGTYTFHITGTIKGKSFDRFYTSGEKGAVNGTKYNDIQELGPVAFPEQDPSNRELALALRQAEQASANQARLGQLLGVGGIALGAIALALTARQRRRSG